MINHNALFVVNFDHPYSDQIINRLFYFSKFFLSKNRSSIMLILSHDICLIQAKKHYLPKLV